MTPAEFNAAFPSAWWRYKFIAASGATNSGDQYEWNMGQAGMFNEVTFVNTPNTIEYIKLNFDRNEEGIQWATSLFSMPFNWKFSSGIKIRQYWASGTTSFGNIDWEVSVRSIGDGETMRFNQTYTNNNDAATVVDSIMITDELTYTPYTDGSALAVNDMFQIMIRRGNNDANVPNLIYYVGMRIAWEIDATLAVP